LPGIVLAMPLLTAEILVVRQWRRILRLLYEVYNSCRVPLPRTSGTCFAVDNRHPG